LSDNRGGQKQTDGAELIVSPYRQGTMATTTCTQMAPICTSNGAAFAAAVGTIAQAGNNYGCLRSQPSPAWYFLRVAQPGRIEMRLAGTHDVDYALWGPSSAIVLETFAGA
jgi:hypothetical protein